MARKSGRNSNGQFVTGSSVAKELGRQGGRIAQRNNRAHKLTDAERREGGRNSRRGPMED